VFDSATIITTCRRPSRLRGRYSQYILNASILRIGGFSYWRPAPHWLP